MSPISTILPLLNQPATPGAATVRNQTLRDLYDPSRRFLLSFVLAFVFLRVSVIHELLATKLGFNSYLLALLGAPALLGVIVSGGIRRTLQARASRYWLAFFVWVILAIAFSSWKSGSLGLVATYGRTELSVLFMLAGMPLIWSECRSVLHALALGSFCCVVIGRLFMISDYGGERMSLAFGTIGNSNDFAAHLLVVLPFLLFVIMSARTKLLFRVVSGFALLYGLFLVLATASRGALVGLGAVALYVFWRGTARLRISMLVGLPVLVLALIAVLPGSVLSRLQTFSTSGADAPSLEAAESARVRRYEFETSIRYSLENPLFGVGPGQFSNYEGQNSKILGGHGNWLETHSILTQVSSECGIPALGLFMAAIGSTWLLIHRVQKLARLHSLHEIWAAAFCLGVALVGFFTAALFLNLAYRFYFPALTGLAIALYSSAMQEISALQVAPIVPPELATRFPVAAAPVRSFVPDAASVSARTYAPASGPARARKYRFGRVR